MNTRPPAETDAQPLSGGWTGPAPDLAPDLAHVSLMCRCPRCGRGKLFGGMLARRPACAVCGLDFSGFDTGDGFAVPVLIVLGAIVVGAAFWVDTRFSPPLWVHALIWPPIVGVLVVVMTRTINSFLAAQQFRTRRSEMGA